MKNFIVLFIVNTLLSMLPTMPGHGVHLFMLCSTVFACLSTQKPDRNFFLLILLYATIQYIAAYLYFDDASIPRALKNVIYWEGPFSLLLLAGVLGSWLAKGFLSKHMATIFLSATALLFFKNVAVILWLQKTGGFSYTDMVFPLVSYEEMLPEVLKENGIVLQKGNEETVFYFLLFKQVDAFNVISGLFYSLVLMFIFSLGGSIKKHIRFFRLSKFVIWLFIGLWGDSLLIFYFREAIDGSLKGLEEVFKYSPAEFIFERCIAAIMLLGFLYFLQGFSIAIYFIQNKVQATLERSEKDSDERRSLLAKYRNIGLWVLGILLVSIFLLNTIFLFLFSILCFGLFLLGLSDAFRNWRRISS